MTICFMSLLLHLTGGAHLAYPCYEPTVAATAVAPASSTAAPADIWVLPERRPAGIGWPGTSVAES